MNTETIMNFLADNYKWFMIGAGVLLFALIGFLISGRKKKENTNLGVTMNQNDFNQMGTLDQNQVVAQNHAQFIQNPVPEVQQAVMPSVAAPTVETTTQATMVQNTPVNDTIFTGTPVNVPEHEEEKLVIEAPTGTLNENINMDTLGQENVSQIAPVEEEHVIDNQATLEASVAQPTIQAMNEVPAPMMEMIPPEMPTQPVAAPEVPAQSVVAPVMPETQAPIMAADDIPISMTPEEPIMQTPPTPVTPAPEMAAPVAPVPEVPAFQNNTIQQ